MARAAPARGATTARTIRFPEALRNRIAADAERCGRSLEGQVIALRRHHFGEDVDIAPKPADVLVLAAASLANIPVVEARTMTRKLRTASKELGAS